VNCSVTSRLSLCLPYLRICPWKSTIVKERYLPLRCCENRAWVWRELRLSSQYWKHRKHCALVRYENDRSGHVFRACPLLPLICTLLFLTSSSCCRHAIVGLPRKRYRVFEGIEGSRRTGGSEDRGRFGPVAGYFSWANKSCLTINSIAAVSY
jgi:hypothetical protein